MKLYKLILTPLLATIFLAAFLLVVNFKVTGSSSAKKAKRENKL